MCLHCVHTRGRGRRKEKERGRERDLIFLRCRGTRHNNRGNIMSLAKTIVIDLFVKMMSVCLYVRTYNNNNNNNTRIISSMHDTRTVLEHCVSRVCAYVHNHLYGTFLFREIIKTVTVAFRKLLSTVIKTCSRRRILIQARISLKRLNWVVTRTQAYQI